MTAFCPAQFFDAKQQRRLEKLMASWRQARDLGTALPADVQAELDHLVEAELYASANRAAALAEAARR